MSKNSDDSMVNKLRKAITTVHMCSHYISDPKKEEDLRALSSWMEQEVVSKMGGGNSTS